MSSALDRPSLRFRRMPAKFLLIAAVTSLLGCVTVRLVSDYDEPTEKGATALQRSFSEFFVKMQSAPETERRFAAQQAFYQRAVVDLSALQVRAGALSTNTLTQRQLQLIEDNLAYLALLHKGCVTAALTREQAELVTQNGVDTSLDCRKEYGATDDLPNRGNQVPNPAFLPNLQGQFNQALGAVIALEIAKRRGESAKAK